MTIETLVKAIKSQGIRQPNRVLVGYMDYRKLQSEISIFNPFRSISEEEVSKGPALRIMDIPIVEDMENRNGILVGIKSL
jgi:hypothetical protein